MQRLRHDIRGQPLSRREHELLYERAISGSLKEAAATTGMATGRNQMRKVFVKLGVTDEASAYAAMGWLHPLPYGVSPAEMRHEQLDEEMGWHGIERRSGRDRRIG